MLDAAPREAFLEESEPVRPTTNFQPRHEVSMDERTWLRRLLIEEGKLSVVLGSDRGPPWSIDFDRYLVVRAADESFRLMSVPTLVAFGARVLECRDSELIAWVQAESAGMVGDRRLIHTVILAADDLIDVLQEEATEDILMFASVH